MREALLTTLQRLLNTGWRHFPRLTVTVLKLEFGTAGIRGFKHLGDVIEGVQFRDGLKLVCEQEAIADQDEQKVA